MMAIAKTSQWLARKGITRQHLLSTTDVKAFGNDFRFSANKAKQQLSWQPQVHEAEGFLRYFQWAGNKAEGAIKQSRVNEPC